jgi:hypothetical protein
LTALNDMKPRRLFLRPIIILTALCTLVCVSGYLLLRFYDLYPDPTSERPFPRGIVELFPTHGSIRIDSASVLPRLASGDTRIFTPMPATPETSIEQNQILWQQPEYMQIAKAAFESKWGPSTLGWDLVALSFDTSCQGSQSGFSTARITYYKLLPTTPSRYNVRQLEIQPQLNRIDWGEDGPYPRFLFYHYAWTILDMSAMKLGANEILRIAQDRAAQLAALSAQGSCKIYLRLDSSDPREWYVSFDGAAVTCPYQYFHVYVDAQTGEIRQTGCGL